MPQARGTDASLTMYEETAYGQDPAAPSGTKLRFHSVGVKGSQNTVEDPTLSSDREQSKPVLGNQDAAGSIPLSLSAEQDPKLLKHTLGTYSTFRPVGVQPVNVTGVVIKNANVTCDIGLGVLAFTLTGTLLSWQANGDTVGVTVDVSAGGDFTLPSGTADKDLYVTVTAGNLPGGNVSDADIDVVNAYEHIIQRGDLPIGITFDKDFGSNITGVGRVEKINGNRVGSCGIELAQEGVIVSTYEFKGAKSVGTDAVLDATPDDLGHVSFGGADLTVKIDGIPSVITKSASLNISNELDEDGFVVGSNARKSLPEGSVKVDGNISALFESNVFLDKAEKQTETTLDFEVSRGDGFGTQGNEYINFGVQQCVFAKDVPEISGPGGVVIESKFTGYRGTNNEPSLIVKVRNQQATL